MENNDSFEFTYSAPEQEEIRKIRDKYLPQDERTNKMELLRQLDASVTRKGTVAALCLGVISTLIFGISMCCCMVWTSLFFVGILIGIVGMAGMGAAYPVYSVITKKERQRIAPQILKLTEDLMQ